MKTVLKNFITQSLFDASAEMLEHLHIKFSPQSKTPIHFGNLYFSATSQQMPKQLAEVMEKVKETFFIGTIDEESLHGHQSEYDLEKPVEGKYQTMMVFAVDIKHGETLTRSELSTLTRGFNRMASSLPVILFVKNGNRLSLATCERSEYRQDWRDGEKLGKVSILRDINLEHPHRGHIDILETLGDKAYPTFDDLYKHWLDVFSSELLTKKFYTELSEWYAWVIGSGKVKFPNDIRTTEDDTKYNHEAVIRLITRLIFVWFLKQKKLIPEEFFDEDVIRDNFIENFDPHSTNTLFYNPEESKYYRLILQNLFFAMLNRPIKDEETGNDENRRFVTDRRYNGISADFNINNLLRYKSEFKTGGAEKLLEVANSQVPFLNGGLFECLDHKDSKINDPEYGMYYDGFTENSIARKQLAFPDYFFFGNEVGSDIDLSGWYDDKKKTHSKVRGLIDILKNYNFTVEENTPLDQEVSLDPELLGKVFENLLASYNPETKSSARKQTGSFYTPRPIVQYMVDECLIAYLTSSCPEISESTIRNLFDYSNDNFNAPINVKQRLISSLYACKVLDPACGSGAFPMGILQQMVHALRKLDPTNEMWKEFILEIALGKDREAYKIENEDERAARRRDIEEAFNQHVNDPDYARKLYLIENCIYGIDIQPIATQISKLRFFISLVAEQKPTTDPISNFGIRPLPNLEAKIVAANSLIPLGQGNLFTETEEINKLKEELAIANHKLFIAKRNTEKRKLKEKIRDIRRRYTDELIDIGAVDEDGSMKLAKWDMFDPNKYAKFFDPQWMFGIANGFDIVIGNPPYISVRTKNFDPSLKKEYKNLYKLAVGQYDLYILFIELAHRLLNKNGVLSYIVPTRLLSNENFMPARKFLKEHLYINTYVNTWSPFEAVAVEANIMVCSKSTCRESVKTYVYNASTQTFLPQFDANREIIQTMPFLIFPFVFDDKVLTTFLKIHKSNSTTLEKHLEITRGFECGYNDERICEVITDYPLIKAEQINPYVVSGPITLYCNPDFKNSTKYKQKSVFEAKPKFITKFCSGSISFAYDTVGYYNTNSVYNCKVISQYSPELLLGILNAPTTTFWFNVAFMNIDNIFPHIQKNQLESILIPNLTQEDSNIIIDNVRQILERLQDNEDNDVTIYNNNIAKVLYRHYKLDYDDIKRIDPQTSISKEEYNDFIS